MAGLWGMSNAVWGMYGFFDGQWAAVNLQAMLRWSDGFDFSPFNPLAGLGSLFLPNLPWLNPGAWPFVLPWAVPWIYLLSYLIYLSELMAASYLLFRVLSGDRLHSFLAMQFVVLCFFPPYFQVVEAMPWYAHAPVNAHLAAMASLALACLLGIGGGGLRTDLLLFLAILAAAVSAFASAPFAVLTYLPVYGFFLVALLCGRRPPPTALARQAGAVLCVVLLFWLAGVPDYVSASASYSGRSGDAMPFLHPGSDLLTLDYWADLLGRYPVCRGGFRWYSLCPTSGFGVLQMLALAGAAALAVAGGRLRPLGIAYLLFVPLTHLWDLTWLGKLLGPASGLRGWFLVWASLPFLAFTACVLPARAAGWLAHRAPARLRMRHLATLVAPVLMAVFWFAIVGPSQPAAERRTDGLPDWLPASALRTADTDGAVLQALVRDAAIAPGAPFRGWVATYLGEADGWILGELSGARTQTPYEYLYETFGNGFQVMDLWALDIPTLDEYGQWIGRPVLHFGRKLLAPEGESLRYARLRNHRLDLPLLRLLGVSHLITDAPLDMPGLTRIASQTAAGAPGEIALYRLSDPNLGTYSPTAVAQVASFDEALAFLAANGDRLRQRGVAFQLPGGPLAPASRSSLTMIRDGWQLTAASPGRSVIAVPVRFSHCWSVSGGDANVRLYRGNAIQTFVEFEGEIDIEVRFAFGPFGQTGCRTADVDDLAALGI